MAGTPFSFCFFSTLHAGAEIAAHSGPCNLRLRCHLPLIVPPKPQPQSSWDAAGDQEVEGYQVRERATATYRKS